MGILLDPNALFVPTIVLPTLSPTYATYICKMDGGGSPNLVGLVEWKVPVERRMGATHSFH